MKESLCIDLALSVAMAYLVQENLVDIDIEEEGPIRGEGQWLNTRPFC